MVRQLLFKSFSQMKMELLEGSLPDSLLTSAKNSRTSLMMKHNRFIMLLSVHEKTVATDIAFPYVN